MNANHYDVSQIERNTTEYANGIIPPTDISWNEKTYGDQFLTKDMVDHIRSNDMPDFGKFMAHFDTADWSKLKGIGLNDVSKFIPDEIEAVKADVYVSYGPREHIEVSKADGHSFDVAICPAKLVCLDVTDNKGEHSRAYIITDDLGYNKVNLEKFGVADEKNCFNAIVLPNEKIDFLDRTNFDTPHSFACLREPAHTTDANGNEVVVFDRDDNGNSHVIYEKDSDGNYVRLNDTDYNALRLSFETNADYLTDKAADILVSGYIDGNRGLIEKLDEIEAVKTEAENILTDASLLFHDCVGNIKEMGNKLEDAYERLTVATAENDEIKISEIRTLFEEAKSDYIEAAKNISVGNETVDYETVKSIYTESIETYGNVRTVYDYISELKNSIENNQILISRSDDAMSKIGMATSTDIKPAIILDVESKISVAEVSEETKALFDEYKEALVEKYNAYNEDKYHIGADRQIYNEAGFRFVTAELSVLSPSERFSIRELDANKIDAIESPLVEKKVPGTYDSVSVERLYDSYKAENSITSEESESKFDKFVSGEATENDIDLYAKGKYEAYSTGDVAEYEEYKDAIEKGTVYTPVSDVIVKDKIETSPFDSTVMSTGTIEDIARNATEKTYAKIDREKGVEISQEKMKQLESKYDSLKKAIDDTTKKLTAIKNEIEAKADKLAEYDKYDPRIRSRIKDYNLVKLEYEHLVHKYVKAGGAVGDGCYVVKDSTAAERFHSFDLFWKTDPYMSFIYKAIDWVERTFGNDTTSDLKDNVEKPENPEKADVGIEVNNLDIPVIKEIDLEDKIGNPDKILKENSDDTVENSDNIEKNTGDKTDNEKSDDNSDKIDSDDISENISDDKENISVHDEVENIKEHEDELSDSIEPIELDNLEDIEMEVDNEDEWESVVVDDENDIPSDETDDIELPDENIDAVDSDTDITDIDENDDVSDEDYSDIEEKPEDISNEDDEVTDGIDEVDNEEDDVIGEDPEDISDENNEIFSDETDNAGDETAIEESYIDKTDDKDDSISSDKDDRISNAAISDNSNSSDTDDIENVVNDIEGKEETNLKQDDMLENEQPVQDAEYDADNEMNEYYTLDDYLADMDGYEYAETDLEYYFEDDDISPIETADNFIFNVSDSDTPVADSFIEILDKSLDSLSFTELGSNEFADSVSELLSAFTERADIGIDTSSFVDSATVVLEDAGVPNELVENIIHNVDPSAYSDPVYVNLGGEQVELGTAYISNYPVDDTVGEDVINETIHDIEHDFDSIEVLVDLGVEKGLSPEDALDISLDIVAEIPDYVEEGQAEEILIDAIENTDFNTDIEFFGDTTDEIINDTTTDNITDDTVSDNYEPDYADYYNDKVSFD